MNELRNNFMRQLNWFLIITAITIFYFSRILDGPITGWSHVGFGLGYMVIGSLIWVVEETKVAFLTTCVVFAYCLCYAFQTWQNDLNLLGFGYMTIIFFSLATVVGFFMILGGFLQNRRDHKYRRRQTAP